MSEPTQAQFRIIQKDGSLNIKSPSKRVNYRDLYHDLLRLSWPKFALWFATMFFLINAFFGLVYFFIPNTDFEGLRNPEGFQRYLEGFFFSVQTLGTIGYGRVSPVGLLSNAVVTIECYTGLFVVAVMTGLIFARFAKPHVKVVFSRFAVIKKFDEIPCLMFRIANERQNHITDARVRVYLVMDDAKTGYRDFQELKLEREYSPIFALSWTIAHDIDQSSPLFGLSPEYLKSHSAEIIVSFSGIDTTLSQSMHAKSSYLTDEILPDHDFVDVIERQKDQSVILRMDRFHEVVHLKV
jgi:inward rectifier potassium channel